MEEVGAETGKLFFDKQLAMVLKRKVINGKGKAGWENGNK